MLEYDHFKSGINLNKFSKRPGRGDQLAIEIIGHFKGGWRHLPTNKVFQNHGCHQDEMKPKLKPGSFGGGISRLKPSSMTHRVLPTSINRIRMTIHIDGL
jgi:hypothetical protein